MDGDHSEVADASCKVNDDHFKVNGAHFELVGDQFKVEKLPNVLGKRCGPSGKKIKSEKVLKKFYDRIGI